MPLPELGLVLNLKEKKAVLNPTIKPELGVGTVMDTPASIGIHGVGMSYTAVSGLGSFWLAGQLVACIQKAHLMNY